MTYNNKLKLIEYLIDNGWNYNEKFERYEKIITNENKIMISKYSIDSYFLNQKGYNWILDLISKFENITTENLKEIIN